MLKQLYLGKHVPLGEKFGVADAGTRGGLIDHGTLRNRISLFGYSTPRYECLTRTQNTHTQLRNWDDLNHGSWKGKQGKRSRRFTISF